MTNQPDTFTDGEVELALRSYLDLGESCGKNPTSHDGNLSGDGWAARVLRYHLDCLKAHQKDDLSRAEFHKELLKP